MSVKSAAIKFLVDTKKYHASFPGKLKFTVTESQDEPSDTVMEAFGELELTMVDFLRACVKERHDFLECCHWQDKVFDATSIEEFAKGCSDDSYEPRRFFLYSLFRASEKKWHVPGSEGHKAEVAAELEEEEREAKMKLKKKSKGKGGGGSKSSSSGTKKKTAKSSGAAKPKKAAAKKPAAKKSGGGGGGGGGKKGGKGKGKK